LKIALVMTAREINVVPAYEEWDALHAKKGAVAGAKAGLVDTVDGNRAYQQEKGAAHPADGFPVRVELRRRGNQASVPRCLPRYLGSHVQVPRHAQSA